MFDCGTHKPGAEELFFLHKHSKFSHLHLSNIVQCNVFSIAALIGWRGSFAKGQRSAEKEQTPIRTTASTQTVRAETSPPTVLAARSRNSEWVRYFLLSQSEETVPLVLRDKSEAILCSLRQPPLVTFALYASWWVMSQELHNKTILETRWHASLV